MAYGIKSRKRPNYYVIYNARNPESSGHKVVFTQKEAIKQTKKMNEKESEKNKGKWVWG